MLAWYNTILIEVGLFIAASLAGKSTDAISEEDVSAQIRAKWSLGNDRPVIGLRPRSGHENKSPSISRWADTKRQGVKRRGFNLFNLIRKQITRSAESVDVRVGSGWYVYEGARLYSYITS